MGSKNVFLSNKMQILIFALRKRKVFIYKMVQSTSKQHKEIYCANGKQVF